ncbi:proteoglycan 4-like [Tribolium madens]|uniref:proteoglycan 4-like n=1 Tax=Tribolium madens TaxID=41895 RepID=UPI001CF75CB5|nr:proteoglycan 4-like [Tribolium madens]
MSPLSLVGILVILAPSLADVSHVLDGSAHPPDPQAVNHLATPGQYWWMNSDSPLKAAYDYYKKCNAKGNCITPVNPDAAPQPFRPQPLDVKHNPFLNGNYDPKQNTANVNEGGIDISKNPFLSGKVVTSGGGEAVVKGQDGFLGVQPAQPFKKPGFATTHPLEAKKKPGFDTSHPIKPGTACKGAGFGCVDKKLCVNGVVNKNGEGLLQTRSDVHYCADEEVCCQLNNLNEITAGKSSVPESTIKFAGGAGFSPGFIHVQPLNVQPDIVFAGEHGHHSSSSTSKSIRDTSLSPNSVFSSTVDYSDTKFDSDVRFASTFQGPAYLPPVAPTTPSKLKPFEQSSIDNQYVTRPTPPKYVPPSPTIPTPSPTYRPTPSPTYRPAPSPTYRPAPSPSYRPAPSPTYAPAPSPTYRPTPSPTYRPAPSTSREYLPPVSPTSRPSTQYQPSYQPPQTTSRPYQPPQTTPRPYQPPQTTPKPYQPPYQPPQTTPRPYQPPYQPPQTTPRPYQPPQTTPKPYQPPYQPPQTTPKPYQPPYQPPQTTPKPYQPPYQPPQTTPKPYQPPYQPPQSTPKPYQPPYQPPQTSLRPYQPPQTTPRPYQPSYQPSTSRPTTSREYLPPQPSSPRPPSPFIPQQTTPRPTYQPQPRPTPPPYRPSPQPSSTPGYQYPSPSPQPPRPTPPPFRPSPSIPQPRPTSPPFQPQPSPTPGYQYPTPSPQPRPTQPPYRPTSPPFRPTPSIPQFPSPSIPQYTPAPPQPQRPTGGYEYPKPTPTFGYPTPRPGGSSSNVDNQYVPPPKKPTEGDQNSDAANLDGTILRPTTPRTQFQGELNTAPPPGCAAALKCVQEIYCTAEGVISPVPVVLTKEQELSRVPTTVCQDTESGIIGKCCRDPNYKDPWPSANLVNGVDDGQYKEDDSIGQYSPDLQRNVRSEKGGPRQDASNINVNVQQPQPTCGERHQNTNPKGPGPLDVNFAEIPWQAMVLRDSNRSLLCGGAIIRRNAVITAAHCVEGLETSDILVKGGEWKLGIDEEPLPFQIIKVAVVVQHPQYQPGSFLNDLALLVLEEKFRPSKNIGTLCLPPPNQIPTENCIATGWGKRILQLHAKGAIMHSINVNVMDNQQCQETLKSKFQHAVGNHSPNTLCGYSNIDQCKVDYGSALACNTDGRYTLSGIYSWDTGCKQEGQIGGYVAPDVDWIKSTLAKPITELKKLEN